ncbi:MAG: ParA family protein [Vicinamibacterales bacterium]|jgi:chromosome partitioning protein|nr:sporulation initiation inhibitor Soj [Acidobacteriota bacterium]MDP6371746.1 ParA family protein [Vicinamibacterales bacterium]MDP6609221.1 ParA family protein [Vicinamibacterales bacterium]HAK56874.1 sporulation initiation inhibitor Soj [Acidobacteriota bacterium]|tara:strand:- start:4564 stop:5364 length:801 start_codon:yes stop_codon:yes gene_type:complete
MSARIVAVANQKGGVGKTTTAINLAASLALADRRVLAIDTDPQANLTSGLGLKGQAAPSGTVYQALTAATIPDFAAYVIETQVSGLSLVPSDRHLTGAELEMISLDHRETRLRELTHQLLGDYDYIFIDTPPSLGLLTLNGLVAADTVLIPLHSEYFALEGLADLVTTLQRIRASLNPDLGIEGVLLTMHDGRTNLSQQVSRDIRDFFKDKVFDTVVPRNVRLGEAPSHGLPAILYDVKSRGAEAYVALAKEILGRDSLASRSTHG